MTQWVAILGGSGGLITSILAVLMFLQNRRTIRLTQPKTDAEKQGQDIENLRGIIAELRISRDEQGTVIARLQTAVQRHEVLEKAHLRYESAMSEYLTDHWKREHPGETPAPPTFQFIEIDT